MDQSFSIISFITDALTTENDKNESKYFQQVVEKQYFNYYQKLYNEFRLITDLPQNKRDPSDEKHLTNDFLHF